MALPRLNQHLPEMTAFGQQAAHVFATGSLYSRPQLAERVKAFFTPARMTAVETVVPGWQGMSAINRFLQRNRHI